MSNKDESKKEEKKKKSDTSEVTEIVHSTGDILVTEKNEDGSWKQSLKEAEDASEK